jgi:NADPH:quinone reductase-like Zn-dependent oxidoreductase
MVLAAGAFVIAYVRSSNSCNDPQSSAVLAHPMKAIVYCDYGDASVLSLKDVEKPAPAEGEILVRVRAASVNPLDWHFMRGSPYLMRTQAGLRKPAVTRLGVDFAGTVEAVGPGVTRFKPGDEVFGGKTGAFAQYVCARQDRAAAKPPGLTFEQAASMPIAALTALQAVRDHGKVGPGTKVLINGASGGVGTFAVQIAKQYGGEVAGVCSGRNVEMVRSLGATRVFDYTKEDFAKSGERYDFILDNVGNRTLSEFRSVLAPRGRYVLIGGGGPADHTWIGPFGRIIGEVIASKLGSQQLGFFVAQMTAEDLGVVADLAGSGKIVPVIDRSYPLAELPSAIRYLEEGHARGKVVITVE